MRNPIAGVRRRARRLIRGNSPLKVGSYVAPRDLRPLLPDETNCAALARQRIPAQPLARVAMRSHHPLRPARRARRVDHIGEVVGTHRAGRRSLRRAVDLAAIDAHALLPDMLSFDPTRPAEYPNGRVFTDDVINHRLAFLSKGEIPPDGLRPHADTLKVFPYLGTPHAKKS